MALSAKKVLAAANSYTDETVVGGGAIKGKNCTIDSIVSITGGNKVTFKWTLDDGTVQETTMDVMNGKDGKDGIQVYASLSDVPTPASSDKIVVYIEDEACFYFWNGSQWIPQQADVSALTLEQVNNLISLL